MKKVIISFLTILCTLLTCNIYTAKGQTTLTGRVIDTQNQAVNAALVMILDENENVFLSVITDSTGVYSIQMPGNPEKYSLFVTGFGYHQQKTALTDAARQSSFALEAKIHELDEVTVMANRPAIIRGMDKFVVPQIYQSPLAQGKNIVDFLKFAPLINVSNDDVLGILNKGPAVIYVNGRRSNIDVKSLPAENIEKVEIIPFPGSEYRAADRSRGIINIILRSQPEDGVLVNMTISDRQQEKWVLNSPYLSMFFNIQKKKLNISTGFSSYYNPFIIEETGTYHHNKENLEIHNNINKKSAFYGSNGFVSLDYHFNNKHTLGFRAASDFNYRKENNTAETSFRVLNSLSIDSTYFTNSKLKQNMPNYSISCNLNYNIIFNHKQKLTFDLDYYHSQLDMPHYFINSKFRQENTIFSEFRTQATAITTGYNFATRFQKKFNEEIILKAGLECYGATRDNDYFFGNKTNKNFISDPLQTNNFIFKDITGASYLKMEWEITDELSLATGLRSEYYDYKGTQKVTSEVVSNRHSILLPSVSVYYELHKDHELGFDFTSSYNPPSFSMLNTFKLYYSPTFYQENNPDLKPYKDYEFALEYILFSDYMFVFEYCYTKNSWADFRIPVGNGITKMTTKNYGKDHNFTISFSLTKRMLKDFLFLSFIQSFDYFTVQEIPSEIAAYNSSGYSFWTDLKINTALNKKKDWRIETRFQFVPENKRVSSVWSTILDLSASICKNFKNSTLSFGVSDILDRPAERNMIGESFAYNYNIYKYGRTYMLTYNLSFGNNKSRGAHGRERSNIQERLQ